MSIGQGFGAAALPSRRVIPHGSSPPHRHRRRLPASLSHNLFTESLRLTNAFQPGVPRESFPHPFPASKNRGPDSRQVCGVTLNKHGGQRLGLTPVMAVSIYSPPRMSHHADVTSDDFIFTSSASAGSTHASTLEDSEISRSFTASADSTSRRVKRRGRKESTVKFYFARGSSSTTRMHS